MKILLLNQTFYPDNMATAQHATDLVLFLIEQGHEVTAVAGERGYEDRAKRFPKKEIYQKIVIERVASTGFGKTSILRRIVDSVTFDFNLMLKLLTLPKFDLCICLTSPPLLSLFGYFFKMVKGGHLVQWLMDINPEAAIAVGYLKPRSLSSRVLLGLFRWTLMGSDRIVVLDRWMKAKVAAHGVPENRIVVVPPWPVQKIQGPPTEAPDDPSNPYRQKLGLGNKFVVLYSGNHSVVHPLDTLLESARLLKDNEEIRFVFVGGGLRVEDVTSFVQKHDLKNVIQMEYQPRHLLPYSLAMANLHVVVMGNAVSGLVHTSKIYGILASGRPYVAICPKKSHLYDLLQECPCGFHVEHGDPKTLTDIILKAKALGKQTIQEYSVGNYDYVLTHFTRAKLLGNFHEQAILSLQSIDSNARAAHSAVGGA